MPDVDQLATAARERIGQVLRDKWQLDALLGVGGMAAVYSATHRNGNKAAIKLLHPHICAGSEEMSRFVREGRAANHVNHPGAVAVLDDDVDDDGAIFVVMELLEGETLAELADRNGGTVPVADVLRIADEVLDVLATAHENGVVHRDLKPDNVFVLQDGTAKVLDFGIAHLRDASNGGAHSTANGMLMGTPDFMPPEQARGDWERVDGQSDVWAVGATMFAALAGRSVHDAKTMSAQLVLAGTSPAPPLASVSTGVPEDVCALVDRALAFDKPERWPNARAMQDRVREIRADAARKRPIEEQISARAQLDAAPAPRRGKKAIFVLAALVVGLAVMAWRSPQGQKLRATALSSPGDPSVPASSTAAALPASIGGPVSTTTTASAAARPGTSAASSASASTSGRAASGTASATPSGAAASGTAASGTAASGTAASASAPLAPSPRPRGARPGATPATRGGAKVTPTPGATFSTIPPTTPTVTPTIAAPTADPTTGELFEERK